MATFLHRIGLGSARHRFAVITVWVVVLVASVAGALTLSGETVDDFEIPGQESTTALDLMEEKFGSVSSGANADVVFQASDGTLLTDPAVQTEIQALLDELSTLDGVVSVSNPFDPAAPTVSQDVSAGFASVTYDVQPQEVGEAQTEALFETVEQASTESLTVDVTGSATQGPPHIGGASEAIGVIIALAVLALTYGALAIAGMNLLTALIGVAIGALGITTVTGFVDLQSTTPILATMLGLAVGIDYALFIVTRFRQELRNGHDVNEAIALAVGTAGSAVVTAGLTVVIALSGLAIAGIPFLTEMGLAAAATVVIAVLVALTLLPAFLSLLGRKALPKKERKSDVVKHNERGFFTGWGEFVSKRRWVSLVSAVVVLGIVAIPVASMQTTLNPAFPDDSTQTRAETALAENFGEGIGGPLLVLVDGDGAPARAQQLAIEIPSLAGVAQVQPSGVTPDGSAALITVIPQSGPDSDETLNLVHELRDIVHEGSPTAYVTGETAISVDVSETLDKALPLYLLVVVGLAMVLLILVFRSILVPLVGVLGFLLTIGASFGATTAVFQWGWLKDVVQADTTGPVMSLAPIIVVGILFGLAMDYQVFLVSRMHEAYAHGSAAKAAIVAGFRQAGPVVLAAAAIMFSVFGGFVPAGDATVKPIAFALAVGIFFDAVIVRMIAIPAALALMGKAAWWYPNWLRWLPTLDVEGAALEKKTDSAKLTEADK
jgi:putative drug exporter of the RND superfamily